MSARLTPIWLFLLGLTGLGLSSCQTTEEASTDTELVIDGPLSTKAYMPDSVPASVSGRVVATKIDSIEVEKFQLHVTLQQPLGSDSLEFQLFRRGMRFAVAHCGGTCNKAAGEWAITLDNSAQYLLRVMDTSPDVERSHRGLLNLYATRLIADDPEVRGFPQRIPVGLNRDSVQDRVLLIAQKNAKSLAAILDSSKWLPTRNIDSLALLYADLIARTTLTKADSARLFPGPPKLIRLPDQPVRMVAKDSAQYTARWVVSGGTEPISAQIDGEDGSADGSIFSRTVAVGFGINKVTIQVQDRSGAKAFDTITVIRDDGAPSLHRTLPADTTALPFETETMDVVWVATDASGIKSVSIGGIAAAKSDNGWAAKVTLKVGQNSFIATTEDSLGNKSSDTLRIRRLPDTHGPKVIAAQGAGTRLVPYDSATAPVAWLVTDPGAVKSVRIGGALVDGFAGRYSSNVPLKVGRNKIALEATDSSGNSSTDTVVVERHTAMAVKIATRGGAVAALLQDGTIALWGWRAAPMPADIGPFTSVSVGASHILALTTAGTVVGWGDSFFGQEKPDVAPTGVVAVAAGGIHSLALKRDGSIAGWGDTTFGKSKMPYGLSDVTDIAAGYSFSVALKKDGTVWAWGDTTAKQTPAPAGLANVKAIAAGYDYSSKPSTSQPGHVLALLADGTLQAWGNNNKGQASVPTGLPKVAAVAAGGRHSLALLADSTVIGWGDNASGQTDTPKGLKNVIAIAAGDAHSLALLKDGSVIGWGENGDNQTDIPGSLAKY